MQTQRSRSESQKPEELTPLKNTGWKEMKPRTGRLLLLVVVILVVLGFMGWGNPRGEDEQVLEPLPKRISIIVPTYKEVVNIQPLCDAIFRVGELHRIALEVIIVDDDSQDGTTELAERIAKFHPLKLAVRKGKKGLSSAVLHGISLAKYEILVVMDADLSHPPESIPHLVDKVVKGSSDYVVGSRYTEGFWVEEWTLSRRIISLGATLLAKPLLPTPITDPMSGFFAIRRDTFQNCDRLNPLGFKIGLELMVKCHPKNISEIPIIFKDRQRGESKLTSKQQLYYVTHLARLYFYSFPLVMILLSCIGLAALFMIIIWVSKFPSQSKKRKHIKPV